MNIVEKIGQISGYPLGLITGSISFLRASRMFHPKGILVKSKVENLRPDLIQFHPYVMVRFTSAMWKYKVWPDVLGLTLRFSKSDDFNYAPKNLDQDLLFASFAHPWQTPVGPFMTRFRDFFKNTFYAVSPFQFKDDLWIFKTTLINHAKDESDRSEIIRKNIQQQGEVLLWMKKGKENWIKVSRIILQEELSLDQERLYFNPFLNGLNICPRGFVHHLRIGTYRFSQSGRTLRYSIQEILNHAHKHLIVHRLRHISFSK